MEKTHEQSIVFGGGCFWCTEAIFSQLRGVHSVLPGYAGGNVVNPNYEQVSSGTTGHAEVIRILYDPKEIDLKDLLDVFFATHDPTTLNRQGDDVGTQYRSVIFCTDEAQREIAEQFIRTLNDESSAPVVTEVHMLKNFYRAEDYHRAYYERNTNAPYCQIIINPKLEKLQDKYRNLLKS